ncbi:Pr6Pr family membrane protein [Subtercola sp. YIM 133946]|uniref:Pr6Pr family membrane protein n=1 Tax=Subtercola sp. YIM 133946 TaxID=3118909 RepID=UPI002F9514DA
MTEATTDARLRAARTWFGAIAVVVAFALVVQLILIFTGGQDANSGSSGSGESLGTRLGRLFSFFTIQSNLFVLGTSIVLALRPARDGRVWRVLRLDALLGIIITGLVYETVLAPLVHLTGWAFVATICFHYISPWATLIGWLLFGPRPRIPWSTTAWAFVWPVLWLVYTFAHGAVSGWYPYPFLDVTTIGLGDSLRNSAVILVIGIVITVLLTVADHRLPATPRPAPPPQASPQEPRPAAAS